jgi:serine/threonine-protein kinase
METTPGRGLPDTLLSEHVQRVALAAGVAAGLWTYGLIMDSFVRPATLDAVIPRSNLGIEALLIAVAGLMFLYVRYTPHAARIKTDAGLLFFVLNAFGVAMLNNWAKPPSGEYLAQLSWTTVVILVASMIIPASPRRMVTASIVAATMDPFVVWIAHLRGLAVPSALDTFVLFMPNYACAAVAVLPSLVLQRMGHRLRQAQDMGSYRLVEMLGRGGMGEVWRAHHRLLARSAAIKLVRPELLGASTAVDAHAMLHRFEREAQATAALSSPHTIRLFDYGVTADQTFYYVMELLDGRDLESLVREFGPVGADRALFLLEQVCHSLGEAHARGFVHRDITPANIYACRLGLDFDFVKVLDFGLVTPDYSSGQTEPILTAAHTMTGTPAFMAPEIILEAAVDARADIYALGCVAYYLLTGQLVFEAETPMKMLVQHLQSEPIRPSERTEMPIPADVEQIVLACLEKDPAKRPQDAHELLQRLRKCRSFGNWDNEAARVWWDTHLVDPQSPVLDHPTSDLAVGLSR